MRPLSGLIFWMTCWALSELSQKFGSPIDAVSLSRSARLVATSKTLPQMGQTLGDLFDTAAQLAVHGIPFGVLVPRRGVVPRPGQWVQHNRLPHPATSTL